jgi:hypothetical protein
MLESRATNPSPSKGRHIMSTATATQQTPRLDAHQAQALFESMFSHAPKVDLRTPADVKAQAARENWK